MGLKRECKGVFTTCGKSFGAFGLFCGDNCIASVTVQQKRWLTASDQKCKDHTLIFHQLILIHTLIKHNLLVIATKNLLTSPLPHNTYTTTAAASVPKSASYHPTRAPPNSGYPHPKTQND